jgi:16S rRNA (guanine527-N7)-methyltransferase
LIARSTLNDIWHRHILDSAQLARFESHVGASWADVGSGAGLPGIVLATLVDGPVTLIEPRKLRGDFLRRIIEALRLNASVRVTKVEQVRGSFDMITARALAPLPVLFELTHHLSTRKSCWVLPKGRTAVAELEEARCSWQGEFHVEHSFTDADSHIVVGTGVRARK